MPPKVKRYKLEVIADRINFAVRGTGVTALEFPEKKCVEILNWVDGEKVERKSTIAYVYPDLTYVFEKDYQIPCETASYPHSVKHDTTPEQQARYNAYLHTLYMIQLALTCFPYA